jgi:hypothetical protein
VPLSRHGYWVAAPTAGVSGCWKTELPPGSVIVDRSPKPRTPRIEPK